MIQRKELYKHEIKIRLMTAVSRRLVNYTALDEEKRQMRLLALRSWELEAVSEWNDPYRQRIVRGW